MAEIALREAQELVDEELRRLSGKYRAPLVLCYLEGATREEAAKQLHLSLATLKRRLERGRELLRLRLSRRGLTLATTLSGVLLTESTAQTAIPAPLVRSIVRAGLLLAEGKPLRAAFVSAQAAKLMERLIRVMWITKLQTTALCGALAIALTGAGVLAHQIASGRASLSKQSEHQQPDGNALPPAAQPAKGPPRSGDANHRASAKDLGVELLGVIKQFPIETRTNWWKPDGSPLQIAPYEAPYTYFNGINAFEFAFRIPGNAGYSYTANGPKGTIASGADMVFTGPPLRPVPNLRSVVLGKVPRDSKEITIRLGLATQPWQVVEKLPDWDWAKKQPGVVFDTASDIVFTWPRFEDEHVVVDLTQASLEDASRLVAYDRQGKICEARESPGGRGKNLIRRIYRFAGIKLGDVQRFEFQRRPYDTWISFKNVSLQPGHRTTVQVEVEHPAATDPK